MAAVDEIQDAIEQWGENKRELSPQRPAGRDCYHTSMQDPTARLLEEGFTNGQG
jgi:hypothetical protein